MHAATASGDADFICCVIPSATSQRRSSPGLQTFAEKFRGRCATLMKTRVWWHTVRAINASVYGIFRPLLASFASYNGGFCFHARLKAATTDRQNR
ncbi:hypothetical protein KCP69_22165 [Salmonella enterica subsp. enterica]|nr:hypothetical protein KCP69_22165 [Salmonella enterica subsp. enterica]